MKRTPTTLPGVIAVLVISSALATAAPLAAQGQPTSHGQPAAQTPAPAAPETAPLSAGQIQRWFEAFTVLQAQEALQLSEAQYGRFVTRLKAMQEIRRKHQQARNQMIADMRRLTNPQAPPGDDAALLERIRALREEDERAAADLKKAYEGVDETLDVRQQARFRVFEERMEQQKIELLMRARQNARAAARGRGRGSS
jgi:hypothetical protein